MNRPPAPIYLDYQATTPTDPRVVDRMLPWFTERFGNPHSAEHGHGWAAAEAVDAAIHRRCRTTKRPPGLQSPRLHPIHRRDEFFHTLGTLV